MAKQLNEILRERMLSEGWDTIPEGSKVPFSLETTRRIFNDKEYLTVAPHTIAVVARYLGFEPNEIRDLLREHTKDKDLWPMIGDSVERITEDEKALIGCYQKIAEKSRKVALCALVPQLELIAALVKADITEDIDRLKRIVEK